MFRGYAKFPGVGIRAMPVECWAQTCVESVSGLKRVAASEEGEEQRLQVIRQCDERMMEVREARRGYVQGSAWDESNMIQAMARLRNPTIVLAVSPINVLPSSTRARAHISLYWGSTHFWYSQHAP